MLFQELYNTFRRNRIAFSLIIFGLSIAFTAFIIISIQISFQNSYDNFHKDSENIFRINALFPNDNLEYYGISPAPIGEQLKLHCPTIKDYFILRNIKEQTFVVNKEKIRKNLFASTPNIVDILNLEIIAGDAHKALSSPNQLLIPESVALKYFGEESAINQEIICESTRYNISAVYKDFPKNSVFENEFCTYLEYDDTDWSSWGYVLFIQTTIPNRDIIQQQIDSVIFQPLDELFISLHKKEKAKEAGKSYFQIQPITEIYYDNSTAYDLFNKGDLSKSRIMTIIGLFIIFIAIINFVNFFLSIAPSRMKNINTQKVYGASIWQLRIRIIGEVVLFTLIAYLCAIFWLYVIAQTSLNNLFLASIDPENNISLLLLLTFQAVFIGFITGIYPAWYMTSFEPALALKGSFILSPRGIKIRNILLIFQFSISIILIICTLFINGQNKLMVNYAPGYQTQNIIYIPIENKNYKVWEQEFIKIPEVIDCAFGNFKPSAEIFSKKSTLINEQEVSISNINVSSKFPRLFEIPIIKGNDFNQDSDETQMLINEFCLKKYPLFENFLNDTIGNFERARLMGITVDIHYLSLKNPITPFALICSDKNDEKYSYIYLKLKPNCNITTTLDKIKEIHERLDINNIYDVHFINNDIKSRYEDESQLANIITLLGIIAIVLALMGVYGLVVFNAQYRRKEISIRKVNGASVLEIMLLLNKEFLIQLAIAFCIACPIAYYAISKWLENFYYRIDIHWWMFVCAGIITLFIVILTVSGQSYRAAIENPANSLKSE